MDEMKKVPAAVFLNGVTRLGEEVLKRAKRSINDVTEKEAKAQRNDEFFHRAVVSEYNAVMALDLPSTLQNIN